MESLPSFCGISFLLKERSLLFTAFCGKVKKKSSIPCVVCENSFFFRLQIDPVNAFITMLCE